MESVGKLTEMGFSAEQAQKALKATNGDMEAAIAYLFEEPIEVSPPITASNNTLNPPNQDNNSGKSVEIRNPMDVPDFSQLQQQETHANQTDPLHFEHYEYSGDGEVGPQFNEESRMAQVSSSSSSSLPETRTEDVDVQMRSDRLVSDDENSEPSTPSIYDDEEMTMTRSKETPPVILIDRVGSRENVVVPLLTILVQIPSLRKLLWGDLGPYSDTWYKGDDEIGAEVELRRAVAYLSGFGHRAFISSRGVIRSFSEGGSYGLESDELVPKMYESLIHCASDSAAMKQLLQSTVESVEEDIQNKMYLFEVDLEYRAATVYDTLNGLFWSHDLQNLGNIRLKDTGKVLTFQFLGDDEHYEIQPLDIDEEFYPQIYAQSHSDQLVKMHQQKVEVGQKRGSVTSQIMSWTSFEGKRVPSFLDQTTAYLQEQNDEDTVKDISALRTQTANEVASLNSQLEHINHQYSQLDVTNPSNVIATFGRDGHEAPPSYVLAGVVFSDIEYYYRTANGQWIYICYETSNTGQVVGYSIEKREFFVLKKQVQQRSRDASMVVTLVYVMREEYKSQEAEAEKAEKAEESDVPRDLQSFFDSDDARLQPPLIPELAAHAP
ncbi:hypothetical protein JA9_001759 [Meyerozyma sp. JA9]|nr:hypothetical protein JA9_001759 [Meyerozyma sp. JA9]